MTEKIYDDEEDKANAELANIEAQPYPEDEGPQDDEQGSLGGRTPDA